MTEALNDAIEFACHYRACAPPPVGAGGSRKGGKVSQNNRIADVVQRGHAIRAYRAAKKAGDTKAMARHAETYRKARNRVSENTWNRVKGGSTPHFRPPPAKNRQTISSKLQKELRKTAQAEQDVMNKKAWDREKKNYDPRKAR